MSLLRFLGIGGAPERGGRGGGGGPDGPRETETVRRIAAQLDQLPREKARFLACFAFVLARVAHADLEIDESEIAEMERIVRNLGHLSEAEAALVVQIAKAQAQHLGGTENYVVTREFRKSASKERRAELLECVFAVAAADGTISGVESNEILRIAEELGFTRPEANALRAGWKDKLSEFQKGT